MVNLFTKDQKVSKLARQLATGKAIWYLVQKNSHIATLVERKSRYTILLKLKGKDAESVKHALIEKFQSLPKSLRKSLTWDRGMELAQHAGNIGNNLNADLFL